MAKDLLNTYKYGWETSYYQNTMDGKTEDVIKDENSGLDPDIPVDSPPKIDDEEECDANAVDTNRARVVVKDKGVNFTGTFSKDKTIC